MTTRKNGNGNGRESGDVPRWVRLVLDAHEARMNEMKQEHEERMDAHDERMEEMKREHEARMDRLERTIEVMEKGVAEDREIRRSMVLEMDRRRVEHEHMVSALRKIEGRVTALERWRK